MYSKPYIGSLTKLNLIYINNKYNYALYCIGDLSVYDDSGLTTTTMIHKIDIEPCTLTIYTHQSHYITTVIKTCNLNTIFTSQISVWFDDGGTVMTRLSM